MIISCINDQPFVLGDFIGNWFFTQEMHYWYSFVVGSRIAGSPTAGILHFLNNHTAIFCPQEITFIFEEKTVVTIAIVMSNVVADGIVDEPCYFLLLPHACNIL